MEPPPAAGLLMPTALPDFDTLMQRLKVPEDIAQFLLAQQFDTASFGVMALSPEELEIRLDELSIPDLSVRSRAALRLLWRQCHAMANPSGEPSSSATGAVANASTMSSWSETFPPKLSTDQVRALQAEFEKHYPSEILDAHTMPGPRLLSLTFSQVSKKEWKFIPWRYRLSQHLHDEQQVVRPKKMSRIEALSIQDLFMDDIPSREIPNQLGVAHLTQILQLQATAIALCRGAHLGILKQYVHKFVQLASARYEPDTGLRAPNATELQLADQKIWQKVSELLARGWCLDDAVHELTEVRNDLDALLQPRAAPPRSSPTFAVKSKGRGKGKSKPGGKQKGLAPSRPQWVSELLKDGKSHTICLRYNQGKRTDPQCRFLHVCSVSKGNNQACGGNHAAMQHFDAPHWQTEALTRQSLDLPKSSDMPSLPSANPKGVSEPKCSQQDSVCFGVTHTVTLPTVWQPACICKHLLRCFQPFFQGHWCLRTLCNFYFFRRFAWWWQVSPAASAVRIWRLCTHCMQSQLRRLLAIAGLSTHS